MVTTVLSIKLYFDNHPDISLFYRTILLLACFFFGFVFPPLIFTCFVKLWCFVVEKNNNSKDDIKKNNDCIHTMDNSFLQNEASNDRIIEE